MVYSPDFGGDFGGGGGGGTDMLDTINPLKKKPPLPGLAEPLVGTPALNIAPPVTPPEVPPQPGAGSAGVPNVAPMVAPPAGVPGAEDFLTSTGPGNDLQGTQINPTPTKRLQDTQGQTTAAQNALVNQPGFTPFTGVEPGKPSDFNAVNTGAYSDAADTARARTLAGQGLESLVGAPSREDLALQAYDRLEKSSLADANAATQAAFQRNAAGGRLGSGMLDKDVGDIFGQRKVALANARAGLAGDAAGQELSDRLAKLNAARDTGAGFQGQDINTAGVQQGLRGEARTERGQGLDYTSGLRNEARTERGTQRDFQTGDLNRARTLVSDLSGQEQEQTGNEAAKRSELRGERAYQTGQSQQALDNRVQQKMLEDQLLNSGFNRDLSTSKFQTDQANTTQGNADASGQAGSDLIQELLRSGYGEAEIRKMLGGG